MTHDPLPDLATHAPRRSLAHPLAGLTLVWAQGLRENLRVKRIVVTLVILLGTAAAVAYGARAEAGRRVRGDLLFQIWESLDQLVLLVLLPLIALIFVGPIYAREMRQRTMVYLLVRPVSRTTVFLGRFLAGVVPAAVYAMLLALGLIVFAGVPFPPVVWTALPLTVFMGVLVLGAIYCTLGAIFKHGLVAALLYTFVVEVLVGNLPGSIQQFSVRFHVRSLYHGLVDGPFGKVSADIARETSRTARSEGNPLVKVVASAEPTTSIPILLGIAVVALLIGIRHVRGRDFALKD